MSENMNEKTLQEKWGELRTDKFLNYRTILAHYCGVCCIEEAKGPDVLDLACGEGRMFGLFKEHFSRVVGVDASGFALGKARKRHPDVEFHESLIEDLDITDKFDSVLLLNVLEHVRTPVDVLEKAAKFLKSDGKMLVQVPNAEAINRKMAVIMGTLEDLEELSPYDDQVTGHRRYYTLDALKKDIADAGLIVEKTGGVLFKMLSTAQMDWFLENGLWEQGGFGWGRVGNEKDKDWKAEFCRSCYEIGKLYPRECNVIYVVAERKS